MLKQIRTILAATMTSLVMILPAQAQDTPDPDQVLATVNGTPITLGHVIALRADLPAQYDQFPPNLLFRGILDQLIQHELLMQSMEGDPSRASRISIENERRAILAGEVMRGVIAQDPAAEDMQALYDEKYPAGIEESEYRAAHILVEEEALAQSLVEELESGAAFAALAKEHSIGPSAAVGGDLGWFGAGDMVEPFFNAVAALETGQVSDPVQTEFGWHVIKLDETRNKQRPEFEAVRQEIEEELRGQALDAHIAGLQAEADIQRESTEGLDPAVITNTDLLGE